MRRLLLFPRWPLDNTLPAEILRVASLRRLYLGLWDEFPDTDHLPRGAHVFPHLLELGFCRTDIKDKDLDSLLQRSPVLEKLALILNYATPRNVRVRSRSLRCVLFWMSIAGGGARLAGGGARLAGTGRMAGDGEEGLRKGGGEGWRPKLPAGGDALVWPAAALVWQGTGRMAGDGEERARGTRSPIQNQYRGVELCIHGGVSWSRGGGSSELVLNSTL
jgi:hypothetical protein